MRVVYDAGALIAADRHDREIWADHLERLAAGRRPITTAPVVAQVSRSPRQVLLQRFLRGCEIVPFDPSEASAVGALVAKSGVTDVVDVHLVSVAHRRGLTVLTSDPDDLTRVSQALRP